MHLPKQALGGVKEPFARGLVQKGGLAFLNGNPWGFLACRGPRPRYRKERASASAKIGRVRGDLPDLAPEILPR